MKLLERLGRRFGLLTRAEWEASTRVRIRQGGIPIVDVSLQTLRVLQRLGSKSSAVQDMSDWTALFEFHL